MPRSAKEIIAAAMEHLKTARFGLQDVNSSSAERKTAGLLNVAVFGRSATFALQNLSSVTPEFDEWYSKKQEELKADVLMTYFNKLRRKITHEAHAPRVTGIQITKFTLDMLGPAPPGAIDAFLGDSEGRSGWTIRLADGSTDKYFVDIPTVRPLIVLQDSPINGVHDAATLATMYLDKVEAVIGDAKQRFIRDECGPPSARPCR